MDPNSTVDKSVADVASNDPQGIDHEGLETGQPTVIPLKNTQDNDVVKKKTRRFPAHLDPIHQRGSSSGSIQHITASGSPGSMHQNPARTASVTYSGQTELPPLPIPSLEETMNKFLKSLEALQEFEEQREEAKQAVSEFLNGEGPQLQSLLLEYDRQGREKGLIGSYVEEFWTDAYLAPDASVVLVRSFLEVCKILKCCVAVI